MLTKIISVLRPRTIHHEMTSFELRDEFRKKHEIEVGLYSYGCFDPRRIGRKVRIGRYCSFAPNAYVYTRNHGIDFLSTTPYLYSRSLGIVREDTIPHDEVVIGDDVWLGHGAVVLSEAESIGRGSVIAAGAIVTRPIEPYTIAGGIPARPLRRRFADLVIERIESLRWWEWDLDTFQSELGKNPDLFFRPSQHLGK
jgi:virginiamycin A acetyltransferase